LKKVKELLSRIDFLLFVKANLSALRIKENRRLLREIVTRVAQVKGKSYFSIGLDIFVKCLCSTASFRDYASLRFYNLTIRETRAYLTGAKYSRALRYLRSYDARMLLNDKARFLTTFREFTKRDFFYISESTTPEELDQFIKRHNEFIAKPNSLNAGMGVELVDSKSFDGSEAILSYLREKQILLLEELVVNHADLMKFSERSLNTARIVTTQTEAGVKIICAFLKFNIEDGITDNLGTGGCACPINIETGKLYRGMTNKRDLINIFLPCHPKGFSFIGKQIPFWSETVELVRSAMLALRDTYFVAWDVAVTEDGPIVIEGNNFPDYHMQRISCIPIGEDVNAAYRYARKCLAGR